MNAARLVLVGYRIAWYSLVVLMIVNIVFPLYWGIVTLLKAATKR